MPADMIILSFDYLSSRVYRIERIHREQGFVWQALFTEEKILFADAEGNTEVNTEVDEILDDRELAAVNSLMKSKYDNCEIAFCHATFLFQPADTTQILLHLV